MSDFFTERWKKAEEEFLKTFPTPLHCKRPESGDYLWVFWSLEDHHEIQPQQGFQINNNNNDSFSAADVDTLRRTTISDKIKLAFSMVKEPEYVDALSIIQFWAPVTTVTGRRLLSTSGQPFAVNYPDKFLSKYRLRCVEYRYDIIIHPNHNEDSVNNNNNNKQRPDINEQDGRDFNPSFIISHHAPTPTAFLNCLPQALLFKTLKGASPLVDSALECHLTYSHMLPICFPSQSTSSCIGVVEFSTDFLSHNEAIYPRMIKALEEVGLGVFQLQQHIPYQIVSGLKPAKAEIEVALRTITWNSNARFPLAQVWIPFEDDNHVSFSSYLEGTRKKQMLSLKLTGYRAYKNDPRFDEYYALCDMFALEMGEDFVAKTLEDYKPRFCNDVFKLSGDTWVKTLFYGEKISTLAICLNSIHTGAFCYVFEFIWWNDPDSDDVMFVEELLLTLKKLLPSFKLASGAELGDELDFINVGDSIATETKLLKIFHGKRLSPIPEVLEEGRRIPLPMVVDYIAPLEAKYKTTPIPLSREVIEQQFGNTETQAAENLKEPGDELDVLDVDNSTRSEKILQENILLPVPEAALERGKKPMVENYRAPSATKYKTAPILLSREAIEHQYGYTMKEAAKTLNVSLSTLKRKCKVFGIFEWQGPTTKRKVNDSSNQSYTNEEYDGAVQDPSAINKNENTLTIKAEYADDMGKIHLGISEATFITVEKEIGKKFKLTHGTYKLKYLDEDKDWILLDSDQDMSDCIKSSRNLGRIVVRLRVLPSIQPISG